MRAALGKILRKSFSECINRVLPQFELIKAKEVISSGDQLYRWKPSGDIYCFIGLQINKHEDHFTINVACTKDINFGTNSANPMLMESGWLRIQNLWGQIEDYWLMLPGEKEYQDNAERERKARLKMEKEGYTYTEEELEELIRKQRKERMERSIKDVTQTEIEGMQKLAEDAVQLILDHAIPYFDKKLKENTEFNK